MLRSWIHAALLLVSLVAAFAQSIRGDELAWRVGTATSEMIADDSMVIGGGIGPGFVQGQEGKLQATATFIQGISSLCIVAVDVLMPAKMWLQAMQVGDRGPATEREAFCV